jgi:hydrogenase maturation protease
LGPVVVVGCEPADLGTGIGLTPAVESAVETAAQLVTDLVTDHATTSAQPPVGATERKS